MRTGDFFHGTNVLGMPLKQNFDDLKPQQKLQHNSPGEDGLFSHLKHYLTPSMTYLTRSLFVRDIV